jgi:hypothetical protein
MKVCSFFGRIGNPLPEIYVLTSRPTENVHLSASVCNASLVSSPKPFRRRRENLKSPKLTPFRAIPQALFLAWPPPSSQSAPTHGSPIPLARAVPRSYAAWTHSRQRQVETDLQRAWEHDLIVLLETKVTRELRPGRPPRSPKCPFSLPWTCLPSCSNFSQEHV